MAILSHYPSFHSLFPPRHNWQYQLQHSHNLCRFRAFSINKSRKVKTNAELCNDIQEFLAINGLPEGYVPTMKEFSQLGRSDLAYIVRRRGYRIIEKLLGSTKEAALLLDGSNVEKGITEDQVGLSTTMNEYEEPSDVVIEVPAVGNCFDSFLTETDVDSGELENDLSSLGVGENGGSTTTEFPSTENHLVGPDVGKIFESDNYIQEDSNGLISSDIGPEKTMEGSDNLSFGEEDLDVKKETVKSSVKTTNDFSVEEETTQKGWHGDINVVEEEEEDDSSSEVFITENISSSAKVDQAYVSDGQTLPISMEEEKVSNSDGQLESDSYDMLKVGEDMGDIENFGTNFNGNPSNSMQIVTSMIRSHPLRDENLVDEVQSTQFNKDLDDKTRRKDNNVEVKHLMTLLHEKELELSRLKEQIEKEKRALSLLQAKAETEINNAQKLISEKDAELLAAEEMLSELVEVLIRYHGDGEIVEVAGSFNGWHHWIKMDPNPSSSITDSIDSRKFKLWSTVLWLYPGIYEMKFIVDGEWKIDPRMESVSNGSICNNILRVHR